MVGATPTSAVDEETFLNADFATKTGFARFWIARLLDPVSTWLKSSSSATGRISGLRSGPRSKAWLSIDGIVGECCAQGNYFAAFECLGAWPPRSETVTESCNAIGGLARSVMTKRQSGADMSEITSAVESIDQKDFVPIARSIVIAAYGIPRWNGEELKQQAISDFANDVR